MWEDETDEISVRQTQGGKEQHVARGSWTVVASMLLAVMVPVCGWMVSLSNRVSSLEEKTGSLATSAEMSKVEQRISDWIEEANRARIEDREREAKHWR